MHMYTEYIVPITTWLHNHANYALLFTYLTAFIESLAVIGTLIPGSLTMTAIGILAGSGVMPFDLTLCFATLGAFSGDGMSYILGFIYRDRLYAIWPFARYPNLLRYGQDFFNRHGRKSVLIGRFIGPLRSIIPLIAGMMNMPQLHFMIANLLSAIGWSVLYLLPGYFIGAASHQLSSDSARRLLFFVVVLLVAAWIFSYILRALAQNINQSFTHFVKKIYILSKKHSFMQYILHKLSSKEDPKQQRVIRLLLIWLGSLMGTLLLCLVVKQDTWVNSLNQPVCLFLQTLRLPWLDHILIVFSLILNPLCLLSFALLIAGLSLYSRDWRFLRYWISLIVSALLVSGLCAECIMGANTIHLFAEPGLETFPVIHLCLASTLFSFLINYFQNIQRSVAMGLMGILLLSGFASLYLGDNWLTSVLGAYSIGTTLGLLHWILYRRSYSDPHAIEIPILLSMVLFMITTALVYHMDFETIVYQHTPRPKQYMLNQDTWWYQNEPILPLYSTNRVGRRIGVFNIQYAGSIHELERRLITCGWRKQSRSFLYSLIIHVEGLHLNNSLPFMEQLYLNKHPILTMSYHTVKNDNLYILRLWRSNYHLLHYQDPIWLGNIVLAHKKFHIKPSFKSISNEKAHLFVHILPAVHDYQITRMPVKDPHLKSLPYEIPSELLIIKN